VFRALSHSFVVANLRLRLPAFGVQSKLNPAPYLGLSPRGGVGGKHEASTPIALAKLAQLRVALKNITHDIGAEHRADLENYPHLPVAEVTLTRPADYQVLLAGAR
jgi:hypothetical protein